MSSSVQFLAGVHSPNPPASLPAGTSLCKLKRAGVLEEGIQDGNHHQQVHASNLADRHRQHLCTTPLASAATHVDLTDAAGLIDATGNVDVHDGF